jgi:penicillin-binding protein 2
MSQIREHREDLLHRLPRLRLVFLVLIVVVAGRFWFVQAVSGDYYRGLADNNRLREVQIQAPRGLIYERQGNILVENIPAYNLMLDRSRAVDVNRSLQVAAQTLGRPVEELRAAIERQPGKTLFQPVLIAEDLSLSQVARLSVVSLEHPEFETEVGHLRLYRYGPMTEHLLGYLGEVTEKELARPNTPLRSGDLVGRKGIEQSFDDHLRGIDGERIVIVDSRGRPKEETRRQRSEAGEQLELAVDLDLQQEAARFFEGKEGAAVALDPNTGEVRMLFSAPAFNPNLFSRRLDQAAWQELVETPTHPLQDRALQSTYSPGSVFKIIMAVAGLTDGVINTQSRVYCPGSARIYNRRFRCWKRGGHGWVELRRAIKESCDVYFYQLGKELGISRIAHYSRLFGFGQPTGIEISGEKQGLVPDPEWSLEFRGTPWYPGETISVAIGQGPVLVTPIQLATMMATVANGGYRVVPRVTQVSPQPKLEPVGVEPAALEAVRDALWAVVNEKGTGARAHVPGIDVAGKTGTVQVVRQETWIKSEDLPYEKRDHAWFASFATGGDRQLVVIVFVEHGGKGSRAAAPLAKKLYEIYFRDLLDSRQPA